MEVINNWVMFWYGIDDDRYCHWGESVGVSGVLWHLCSLFWFNSVKAFHYENPNTLYIHVNVFPLIHSNSFDKSPL